MEEEIITEKEIFSSEFITENQKLRGHLKTQRKLMTHHLRHESKRLEGDLDREINRVNGDLDHYNKSVERYRRVSGEQSRSDLGDVTADQGVKQNLFKNKPSIPNGSAEQPADKDKMFRRKPRVRDDSGSEFHTPARDRPHSRDATSPLPTMTDAQVRSQKTVSSKVLQKSKPQKTEPNDSPGSLTSGQASVKNRHSKSRPPQHNGNQHNDSKETSETSKVDPLNSVSRQKDIPRF